MTKNTPPNQDVFDENLRSILREAPLPAGPTREQRSRWRNAPERSGEEPPPRFRRGLPPRLMAGGALAASFLLVLLFTTDRSGRVSAETILTSLAHTLTQSVWVEFEEIDLGSFTLNGRLYWDEPRESGASEVFYSELHVSLRPDTPQWTDLETVVVISQSPTGTWTYTRGNGTGPVERLPDGRLHMTPRESFSPSAGHDHREEFKSGRLYGMMPSGHYSRRPEGSVRYQAPSEELMIFEEALDWLRSLHRAQHPDLVHRKLRELAGDVTVRKSEPMILELMAEELRFDGLDQYRRSVDESVTTQFNMNLHFNADGSSGSSWDSTQDISQHRGLQEARRQLDRRIRSVRTDSDELVRLFHEYDATVDLKRSEDGSWKIEARNIQLSAVEPVRPSGAQPLPELMQDARLIVRYDLKASRVTEAEFRQIGGAGVIRIRRDDRGFPAELTDASRWHELIEGGEGE